MPTHVLQQLAPTTQVLMDDIKPRLLSTCNRMAAVCDLWGAVSVTPEEEFGCTSTHAHTLALARMVRQAGSGTTPPTSLRNPTASTFSYRRLPHAACICHVDMCMAWASLAICCWVTAAIWGCHSEMDGGASGRASWDSTQRNSRASRVSQPKSALCISGTSVWPSGRWRGPPWHTHTHTHTYVGPCIRVSKFWTAYINLQDVVSYSSSSLETQRSWPSPSGREIACHSSVLAGSDETSLEIGYFFLALLSGDTKADKTESSRKCFAHQPHAATHLSRMTSTASWSPSWLRSAI